MFDILKPFFLLVTGKKFVVAKGELFKTLLRLAFLKRFFPRRINVVVQLGKLKISAPGYHILSVLLKEKFVHNEYLFTASNDAPVIIDGGSNIGISVLYFKCLYPHAVIHCFEPYSQAYGFLEQNIKQNNLADVYLNKTALANEQQIVELFIPESNGIINATLNASLKSKTSERVHTVLLSSYIAQLTNIDLIKLDIEGAEVAVINDLHTNGAFESGKIKNLIIEFHSSTMSDSNVYERFVGLLKSHAYSVSSRVLNPQSEKSDFLVTAAL